MPRTRRVGRPFLLLFLAASGRWTADCYLCGIRVTDFWLPLSLRLPLPADPGPDRVDGPKAPQRKRLAGIHPGAGGPAHKPAPASAVRKASEPSEHSELSEAVARKSVLFKKINIYTLSLKLSKKQLFVLWTRDSRGGKLEGENLSFVVNVHLKRLPGLEAHTRLPGRGPRP
jgi:hypothetical protein